MILIKRAKVYAPQYLGVKDVLVCADRIEAVENQIDCNLPCCEVIDAEGKCLVPGMIDPHVHVTGGGGEGSFHTQVPPVSFQGLIGGGVTTVVGLLGTDGITRSVENLLAKVKALREEGLTAYACTGSYGYPSVTLTGDVKKDLVFLDEVIGVKLALSDHRAPNVTVEELIRLGSDARVAGMLSGKCGMVVLHMGDDERGLNPVFEALERTAIPKKIFHPTHVTRTESLLKQAFAFANRGGYIDMTCDIGGKHPTAQRILQAKKEGVNLKQITLSSDGMGSWSKYDESGNLVKIGYSPVDTVYRTVVSMVRDANLPLDQALTFATSNTARALELFPKKGCICPKADADLLLLEEDLTLNTVLAMGNVMMRNGKIVVKGTYE